MRLLTSLALLTCSFPVSVSDGRAGMMFMGLGDLAGGATNSRATAVSTDGSTVVGFSEDGDGGRAFRWTQREFESGPVLIASDLGNVFEIFAKHNIPMMDPLSLCAVIENGDLDGFGQKEMPQ